MPHKNNLGRIENFDISGIVCPRCHSSSIFKSVDPKRTVPLHCYSCELYNNLLEKYHCNNCSEKKEQSQYSPWISSKTIRINLTCSECEYSWTWMRNC